MKETKYVNHPRYGDEPVTSNENILKKELLSSHWRYDSVKYFLETAIRADITKQNYSEYPRKIYVDIEVVCDKCNREFIFFAKEQQYWFEELGFYIDSHGTHCFECRKRLKQVAVMQKRYQQLVETKNRSDEQSLELKKVANELFKQGYIKDKRLLNNRQS